MTVTPLTRKQVNDLRALTRTRGRRDTGLFLLEGQRLCEEVLKHDLSCKFAVKGPHAPDIEIPGSIPVFGASKTQIEQVSDSKSSQEILLVAQIPAEQPLPKPVLGKLVLALDRISDPGNLGTILRTAHWFGIEDILLSNDCADPFGPKAVRGSMGAIAGLKVHRNLDLALVIQRWISEGGDSRALHMQGDKLDAFVVKKPLLLVLGSEAHGVAPDLLALSSPLLIPSQGGGESLNAAIAAGIALWELTPRDA